MNNEDNLSYPTSQDDFMGYDPSDNLRKSYDVGVRAIRLQGIREGKFTARKNDPEEQAAADYEKSTRSFILVDGVRVFRTDTGWPAVGHPCPWCGVDMTEPIGGRRHLPSMATVDHLRPRSLGGKNVRSNRAIVCAQCNFDKDDKPSLASWLQELKCRDDPRVPLVERFIKDWRTKCPDLQDDWNGDIMCDAERGYLSAAYRLETEAFGLRMDALGKTIVGSYGARFLGGRTCLGTSMRSLEWQLSENKAMRAKSDLESVGFDVTVRVLA